MDRLHVHLDRGQPARSVFEALLEAMPGAWHIEAAHQAWRAEQVDEGVVLAVDLVAAPDSPASPRWVLSWQVSGDVTDRMGLIAVGTAIAGGTAVLMVCQWAQVGLWSIAASVGTVWGTLQAFKVAVYLRLPDTEARQAALGAILRDAIARSEHLSIAADPPPEADDV